MKPSFTLNFSEDRIDLLHRASGGWLEVGSVPLDEPDLGAALAYLRGSALGLEPRGITTKLVIPNSQILYDSIYAPGPDAANRRRQIRAALEGRTPYGVDDLVFDWSGTGETVQVAVVAKETLAEAETFANDHRFNPISFVAIPESGRFASEPWFGPTSRAEDILAPGEKVDRDQDPIRVVSRVASREESALKPSEGVEPRSPEVAIPEEVEPPADTHSPITVTAVTSSPATNSLIDVVAPSIIEPEDVSGDDGTPSTASAPALTRDEEKTSVVNSKPALRPASAKPQAAASRSQARLPSKALDQQISFSSRRNPEASRPNAESAAQGILPEDENWHAAQGRPRDQALPQMEVAKGPTLSAAKVNGASLSVTAPVIDAPRLRQKLTANPVEKSVPGNRTASSASVQSDQPSMSVFGTQKQRQRGKPKYLGLILTGILLTLLALVAAWSSVYIASYLDADTPVVASTGDPETPADLTSSENPDQEPTPDDEMLADLQDPEEFVDQVNEPAAGADVAPGPEATSADATVAQLPEASPVEAPETIAEVSRNPTNDPQDEIFLAEIDPTPSTSDAIALGTPITSTDALPPAQLAPPPFGTLYTFDADGLIVATPEGIITPEGVRLVAGRPAKIPPPRPKETASASSDLLAPTDAALIEPEPVFAADPALADARPRTRPAGLEPDQTAKNDEVDIAAETTARISSLKPRARPASAVEAAEATANAQADIDAAVQAASASLVASAELPVSGSSLAVAVSRKPAPRPAIPDKAVSEAVEAAVAAASEPTATEAPPATEPTLALAPAKEDSPATSEPVDEPEVTSAAPDIPTRASVAKQATYKNAFNLSKTNLIGVYGTSANRYAMVRQSNGRFIKIEVGDRIDGGRVAAISEREVKYVKNGKTMTLAMPKS